MFDRHGRSSPVLLLCTQKLLKMEYSWYKNHVAQLKIDFKQLVSEEAKKTKNVYGPFLWMGFNCLKASDTSRKQFTFYQIPRYSWYSFYQPRKDERLSRPWGHPVALNTGPLDWKSSTLATRLLFH